jgi:hypothetical protein
MAHFILLFLAGVAFGNAVIAAVKLFKGGE